MNNSPHIYEWPYQPPVLVPSVTTVIRDVIAAHDLERWRNVQVIIMAKRHPQEDFDKIISLADEERDYRASVGTAVHRLARLFHEGKAWRNEPEMNNPEVPMLVENYVNWANSSFEGSVMYPETLMFGEINGLKFAGTPDIPIVTLRSGTRVGRKFLQANTTAIIDIKTGSVPRKEWDYQITGYRALVIYNTGLTPEIMVSARVDRDEVHVHEHSVAPWASLLEVWYNLFGPEALAKRLSKGVGNEGDQAE